MQAKDLILVIREQVYIRQRALPDVTHNRSCTRLPIGLPEPRLPIGLPEPRRSLRTLIWVSNNVSLVPGTKSMPRFVMALSEDVTERKQAEEMLRRSQAKVEAAFEEIKRLKDRLQDENLALREDVDQAFMFEEIVGASPALKTVLSHLTKVAPTDGPDEESWEGGGTAWGCGHARHSSLDAGVEDQATAHREASIHFGALMRASRLRIRHR
jgi:hypothetical protein